MSDTAKPGATDMSEKVDLAEIVALIEGRRNEARDAAVTWERDNATTTAAIARVRADMCGELLDAIRALPRHSPEAGEAERLRGNMATIAEEAKVVTNAAANARTIWLIEKIASKALRKGSE